MDQVAVLTMQFAGIAAVAAIVGIAVAITVPLVLRYRDRVDVVITVVELRESTLFVSIRNRGGTPVVVVGSRFIAIGSPPPMAGRIGHERGLRLAGRDEGMLTYGQGELAESCPSGPRIALATVDDKGRVSKPHELEPSILEWIRAWRPP